MIYIRQKVSLSLMQKIAKKMKRIRLMKLLFLIRQETDISKKSSFYDFTPYKYGPFSFTVSRDLNEMERLGLIHQDIHSVWLANTGITKKYVHISQSIEEKINTIVKKYQNFGDRELINYVYKIYPWYASKSINLEKRGCSSASKASAIYTIGYEQLSIDRFIDYLCLKNMSAIIDVRSSPSSRKYGFSKRTLERFCGKFGFFYHDFSGLGIPRSYRVNINTFGKSDYRRLWRIYEKEIIQSNRELLSKMQKIVRTHSSAILCFEKNPDRCHRSRLSSWMSKMTGLEVVHL